VRNGTQVIRRIRLGLHRRLSRLRDYLLFVRVQNLLGEMALHPDFPASAGNASQHLTQLLKGSQKSLSLLARIGQELGGREVNLPSSITEIFELDDESAKLQTLLDYYGSDKGSFHGYSAAYSSIINRLGKRNLRILEIGLGTNNTDTMSNMGADGKPGASLRAWRDFCLDSSVFGCDIDDRILFSETGIKTFQLDQTSENSWQKLKNQIKHDKFDLIIDDGLHSPLANLQTILAAEDLVTPGGVIVIEDIAYQSFPIWQILSILLENTWEVKLVQGNHASLGILTRRA
jgi:hypothetical protein